MVPSYIHLILWITLAESRTIYLELKSPTTDEISFLERYGYFTGYMSGLGYDYTTQSISEAVKKMQAFAGIPETGELDEPTRQLFKTKRCGAKDILDEDSHARNRRYIVQQGWTKRDVTYKVLNGSSTMGKARIESFIEDALAVWAPHGNLHFTKVEDGKADIRVYFASGNHGDGFPFDGPGRIVAHAFPPPLGDIHFDDDETWGVEADMTEDDDEDITDFFAVAVHEIGHALGMSHSNVKSSVMYPYYQLPVEKLHVDDILGMQELYLNGNDSEDADGTERSVGSSQAPRFTKTDSEEFDDAPDLCMGNYDTVQVIHGKIYVFEEEWVTVLSDRNKREPGYPRRFHEIFIGLPSSIKVIRTIYEKHNKNVVVFSGNKYWEFSRSFRLKARGSLTDYSLPDDVTELTTVFISNYNNRTYLIDDERYWRYDETEEVMDEGYPKDMSTWRDVPYPVDAAIIWKGDTFFFRGPRFWRFDNSLVRAHEYYPLPTAQIWFDCESDFEMTHYTINDGP